MLDPKKKKALKSIVRKAALEQNPNGAIHGELSDQTDHLEEIKDTLKAPLEVKLGGETGQKVQNAGEFISNFLQSIKGEKGDLPIYKKDYLKEDELKAIKEEITPVKGEHYFTPEESQDFLRAATPLKGSDYFTSKEIEQFKQDVTPIKGEHYFDGEEGYSPIKGIDYFDGKDGENGKDGKDGINPDPKDVIKEIQLLKGNDRLDISNLRNAEQLTNLLGKMNKGKIDFSDQRWHGGGDVVAAGSGITISTGANGVKTISTSGGTGITVGTTTITSGTDKGILYDNAGIVGEYTPSASLILATDASKNVVGLSTATYPSLTELSYVKGVTSGIQAQLNAKGSGTVTTVSVATANGFSGTVANATTTPTITIIAGAITPTSVNGLTITSTTGTFTLTNGKTLSVAKSLTLDGTDSTTMTFPSTSASIARIDAAQTFIGTQTFSQVITTANVITASGNAATVPVTSKNNIVTNNSAATLTITLTTTSAVNMQDCIVQILDFSGVAQTLVFVNTENSTVSVPSTSNGSTTLPLTVGFKYNSLTSRWRCVASA